MKGSSPASWLRQMEAEHANLQAALSWSATGDAEEADGRREELGLRLAVALFWFWYTHDYYSEGREIPRESPLQRYEHYWSPIEGTSVERSWRAGGNSRGLRGGQSPHRGRVGSLPAAKSQLRDAPQSAYV
jgi:hypothetical protein